MNQLVPVRCCLPVLQPVYSVHGTVYLCTWCIVYSVHGSVYCVHCTSKIVIKKYQIMRKSTKKIFIYLFIMKKLKNLKKFCEQYIHEV